MAKKAITYNEFVAVINNMKGCQFASLIYSTSVESMNKKLSGGKSNPYNGKVSAITEISVQIGKSYEKAVGNRTNQEFKAESLPWGEWLRPNYLITHKGATYLRAYVTKSTHTSVTYYLNGKAVSDSKTASDIASNIREKSESKRQSEVGIDKEEQVKAFTANIANIVSAVIDGVTYIIVK